MFRVILLAIGVCMVCEHVDGQSSAPQEKSEKRFSGMRKPGSIAPPSRPDPPVVQDLPDPPFDSGIFEETEAPFPSTAWMTIR
jgi:hypothetical protein